VSKRFDYCLNKSKLNTDEKEQIKNKAKTAVHAIVAYTIIKRFRE
jgi:hypothetical protein